jgi:hypothetical protein
VNDDEKRKYEVTKKAYKDGRAEYENKINRGGCFLMIAIFAPIFAITMFHSGLLALAIFVIFLYLAFKK